MKTHKWQHLVRVRQKLNKGSLASQQLHLPPTTPLSHTYTYLCISYTCRVVYPLVILTHKISHWPLAVKYLPQSLHRLRSWPAGASICFRQKCAIRCRYSHTAALLEAYRQPTYALALCCALCDWRHRQHYDSSCHIGNLHHLNRRCPALNYYLPRPPWPGRTHQWSVHHCSVKL